MTCYHPLRAYQLHNVKTEKGKSVIAFNKAEIQGNLYTEISLPCNICIGCRLKKARDWAFRCVNEAQDQEEKGKESVFVTLTYRPESIPEGGTLRLKDFQDFMKRLRQFANRWKWNSKDKEYEKRKHGYRENIRYFQCGEYGEAFRRPHHHACIFGYGFPDKKPWSVRDGVQLFTSKTLEELWSHGWCTIGHVTFESAAYVARYCCKKITGKKAEQHYRRVDKETGEIVQLVPEFATMSTRPAIGAGWFEKYHRDLYPKDKYHRNGKVLQIPRYYDKRLDEMDPKAMETVKNERVANANKNVLETQLTRLRTKEKCKMSKVKRLLRSYENDVNDASNI